MCVLFSFLFTRIFIGWKDGAMPFRMPPLTESIIDPDRGVTEGGVTGGWTTVEGEFVLADITQARVRSRSDGPIYIYIYTSISYPSTSERAYPFRTQLWIKNRPSASAGERRMPLRLRAFRCSSSSPVWQAIVRGLRLSGWSTRCASAVGGEGGECRIE